MYSFHLPSPSFLPAPSSYVGAPIFVSLSGTTSCWLLGKITSTLFRVSSLTSFQMRHFPYCCVSSWRSSISLAPTDEIFSKSLFFGAFFMLSPHLFPKAVGFWSSEQGRDFLFFLPFLLLYTYAKARKSKTYLCIQMRRRIWENINVSQTFVDHLLKSAFI